MIMADLGLKLRINKQVQIIVCLKEDKLNILPRTNLFLI